MRECLQALVSRHLEDSRHGTAAELAREAGVSPGTLSKIRNGIYTGTMVRVAEKLTEAIASREAATAIAEGRWQLAWLVRTRRDLRIVKRTETADRIKQRDPDARLIQIWLGPQLHELHFVAVGGNDASGQDSEATDDPERIDHNP